MAEPSDAVLAYWSEQRQQMRQSEDQRAATTNYVLIITAALAGFIVQQGFQARTIPLSLLVAAIGIYGAASTAKYHERAVYHIRQARVLTQVLCDLDALPDSRDALAAAREAHYLRYPRLHRLRLHDLWIGLNLAIAVLGAALALIATICALL